MPFLFLSSIHFKKRAGFLPPVLFDHDHGTITVNLYCLFINMHKCGKFVLETFTGVT